MRVNRRDNLSELHDSLEEAMKRQSLKKFKRRWTKINKFQDNELRKLSIRQKLHQLNSIIRLAMGMQLDFREDRETRKVRSRWIFLKKGNS